MSKMQQVPLFLIEEETGRVIAKLPIKPPGVALKCESEAYSNDMSDICADDPHCGRTRHNTCEECARIHEAHEARVVNAHDGDA
jgi:hypothetical protein